MIPTSRFRNWYQIISVQKHPHDIKLRLKLMQRYLSHFTLDDIQFQKKLGDDSKSFGKYKYWNLRRPSRQKFKFSKNSLCFTIKIILTLSEHMKAYSAIFP